MAKHKNIKALQHPQYTKEAPELKLYNDILRGGDHFIEQYLKKFSKREDNADFRQRKAVTYLPAFASSAVQDVTNSINTRLVDIRRIIEDPRINEIVTKDVDGSNNSLTSFLIDNVILKLLALKKIGVFIDREDTRSAPYLYTINPEDILNWDKNKRGFYTNLLVKTSIEKVDEDTGLVKYVAEGSIHYRTMGNNLHVQKYNADNSKDGLEEVIPGHDYVPFVMFELKESLLKNIARYQVALLNMASSDVYYLLAANFPFYTEQFDRITEIANSKIIEEAPTSDDADEYEDRNFVKDSKNADNIEVGVTKGRRYGKSLDRPEFIAPPTEPLEASMKKQELAKREIKQLLSQSIANMRDQSTSADSKKQDMSDVESGLLAISLILEAGDMRILHHLHNYYNSPREYISLYPKDFTLKSDEQRRAEGEAILAKLINVPSMTARRTLAKKAIRLMIGSGITADELEKIESEVESIAVIITDTQVVNDDVESGIIDRETASQVRMYPAGTAEKARKEHLERLEAIAVSQTKGAGEAANLEKQHSQNADTNPDGSKKVRS